jgi:4-hydroxy-4-methyl-2-oxoglutarate aldolase
MQTMVPTTNNYQQVSSSVLDFLRSIDTCTVSNAIETFNVRTRNEGFVQDSVVCRFPQMAPVAGYAVTGRIRTGAQPIANLCYYHRVDWWEYVESLPSPKIIVLHDADRTPGIGAFVGEIHARISKALGCVGYLTNGAVRDLPSVERTGFQCFSAGTSVSHAYAHIIDFGEPVEIGGLKIEPGDLLHGDIHGVHTIPMSIADDLPAAVKCVLDREAELIRLCESPDFTLEKLTTILNRELPACQPPERR